MRDLRVHITRLGSIEILGATYVAGLFDSDDGSLEIEWDEGGRETWSYSATEGVELVLTDADGETLNCIPRD